MISSPIFLRGEYFVVFCLYLFGQKDVSLKIGQFMERKNKKSIGQKLHLLRVERHLTQEDMADKLHLSTSAYCKIEYGETDLTLTRLNKIAQIFNMSPFDLFRTICEHQHASNYSQPGEAATNYDNSSCNNSEELQSLFKSHTIIIESLEKRITELEKKLKTGM